MIRRRMVHGRLKTILPNVTRTWVTGISMSFLREDTVDELVIDALIAMHLGGVRVQSVRGRVWSRFKTV